MPTHVALAGERARERRTVSCGMSWLSPLPLLHTRFRCTAITVHDFELRQVGYKGNAFHTRFEAALGRVPSSAYPFLCVRPDAGRKPYVLMPPLDGLRGYLPTLRFEVELVPVGTALRHFGACREALGQYGAREYGSVSLAHRTASVATNRLPAKDGCSS